MEGGKVIEIAKVFTIRVKGTIFISFSIEFC